jgi:Protein of unknown function (DUF3455)
MHHRLFAMLAPFVLSACATQPATPGIPEQLKGGPDETLAFIAAARGVQIYECQPRRDQVGAFEWSLIAPEADLFDERGAMIGKHHSGPHWEANDGSRTHGTVKARVDAPSATAIPWLLLAARSVGPEGALSRITSIQRVNTAGGLAPKDGCGPSFSGARARVEYAADYYFLTTRAGR